MLSTPKTNQTASIVISSAQMSRRRTGGCFDTLHKLPPLTDYMFDEMFRLVEMRSQIANQDTPLFSPVVDVQQDQSGEYK